MANCKIQNIQKRSNKKLCHFKRPDNFTFLKSNYKYKRRYEMKLRNQSQKNRVNRFIKRVTTTTTTLSTDIAIREECNSINELISGNAVIIACCSNSNSNSGNGNDNCNRGNKWQKRTHNAYAMILRILLLITSNLKLHVHHILMHHNANGTSKTIDRKNQGISSCSKSGLGVDVGIDVGVDIGVGGLVTDNDVNIDNDDILNLKRHTGDVEKVIATPLTTSARSSTSMHFSYTSSSSSTSSLSSSTMLPGTLASFVCSTANAPLSSATSLLATSSRKITTTPTTTLSSLLPFSTLCNAVRLNDKLFTYLSALFIAFALCARGVAGGACWQTALNNGKCNQLYSMNISRAECCGRSPDFSFTERDPSDVEYFFATAIGGGMECSPCIESCKKVECASNKKCVKRKGRPKCICAPECGKAARRRRAQQRAKHYRGHLQHHSEQMPRDIRSLSSEITNFNLGLNANGNEGSNSGNSNSISNSNSSGNNLHTSNLENHRNQNQRKTKQHMQSQHNEEEKQLTAVNGSTTNQTKRQQQSTKNKQNICKNQNQNLLNNSNSSNINCKSSQQQQQQQQRQRQNDDDNLAQTESQTEVFSLKASHLNRHQQGRHQKNKRKQRLHQHRQQMEQHHHYHQHQHQHRHRSNTQMQLERELKKHKFKDHQQQTTMTMLTLPVNGATSFLPTSSVASIYNITTATTKSQPHLPEKQTSSSSSSSSSLSTSTIQLATPVNSTTSLPSIFVVAADRHHLLNRGSIFTTSSLSTASQPPMAVSSSSSSSTGSSLQRQQHQQLPPPSAFFTAISKFPLSSSVVEIPNVNIVGVGSNTSPASSSTSTSTTTSQTKTHVNADLALFNIPGLANEPNENVHIDVITHTPHPVCGTDGRTYNSECQLKKRACRTNNSNLKVAYRGHCRTSCNGVKCLNGLMCVEDHYMTPHCILCKIQCPQDDNDDEEPIVNDYERNFNKKTSQQQKSYMQRTGIDPKRAVCGVDGKTYKSTCDINRMICKIGHAIAVAYPGPCRDDRITCNEINCGSKHKCLVDLLTHEPRCVSCSYKCSRKHHPTAHRYENGKICGVNNRTYNSWCEMRKDSCATGFFIDVKAAGKCQ